MSKISPTFWWEEGGIPFQNYDSFSEVAPTPQSLRKPSKVTGPLDNLSPHVRPWNLWLTSKKVLEYISTFLPSLEILTRAFLSSCSFLHHGVYEHWEELLQLGICWSLRQGKARTPFSWVSGMCLHGFLLPLSLQLLSTLNELSSSSNTL